MWQEMKEQVLRRHAGFDKAISEWSAAYAADGGTLFCRRGCSGCCNLAVNATFPEAVAAAAILTDEQRRQVVRRGELLLHLLPDVPDLLSFLRLHRTSLGPCPLLASDGSCGIYASRPLSCRSLLATADSRYCSADFSAMTAEKKRLFIDSLDRRVVAFPMHYVAAMQEQGGILETELAAFMRERTGISLYGNFPFLLYLEVEHGLSARIARDGTAALVWLELNSLYHPVAVSFEG